MAAAVFFRSADTLYGRYWGADADYHSLHFETCYYQGIDYCIEHGLQRFEPGTQGEHKIARGFEPALTWSAHWIANAAAAARDRRLPGARGRRDRCLCQRGRRACAVSQRRAERAAAMITWLSPDDPPERFPPHEAALRDPPGLLAAGGDLSLERLMAAYERGIFPWYSPGQPVLWWSPDPREVLLPQEFHLARRFRRSLRNRGFEWLHGPRLRGRGRGLRGAAQRAAPAPGSPPRCRRPIASCTSAAWRTVMRSGANDRLVGGVYGVRLGRVFFGESMFSRERDASKAALAGLVERSAALGIELIDCQLPSAHLRSLGSRAMPRWRVPALPAARLSRQYATSRCIAPRPLCVNSRPLGHAAQHAQRRRHSDGR